MLLVVLTKKEKKRREGGLRTRVRPQSKLSHAPDKLEDPRRS